MNRKSTILIAAVAACVAVAMLPTSAFAISRDLVVSRGMVWVNRYQSGSGAKTVTGVKYSQSRWAYEDGSMVPTSVADPSSKGYRTDCSGFASLSLNLRDSSGHPYSTCTHDMGVGGVGQFKGKFAQIAKSQLLPGDLLLKSDAWKIDGSGHVIVFLGWANTAQTSYWCMEQTSSSTHNGTIYHTRDYGQAGYRPFRYAGTEEPYADVEESISGVDAYSSAAAATKAAYPTTHTVTVPALVIANAANWGDQVAAASLAGALKGTTLLVSKNTLPSATAAEIKRLKPTRVYLIGSGATISKAVSSKVTSACPAGAKVMRVEGNDRFVIANNMLKVVQAEAKANSIKVDTVYVASGDESDEALSVAPLLAKTARPILFVHKASVHAATVAALKASGIKKVVVLGNTKVVKSAVEKSLRKPGYRVTRISGLDRYKSSMAIAKHALALKVGFSWKRLGVAAPISWPDVAAWAASNGVTGSLVVLTPTKSLDANVRRTAAANRVEIIKARVYGGEGSVSLAARKTLALAMRTGK
jgi:putative cell wall-binding protein